MQKWITEDHHLTYCKIKETLSSRSTNIFSVNNICSLWHHKIWQNVKKYSCRLVQTNFREIQLWRFKKSNMIDVGGASRIYGHNPKTKQLMWVYDDNTNPTKVVHVQGFLNKCLTGLFFRKTGKTFTRISRIYQQDKYFRLQNKPF